VRAISAQERAQLAQAEAQARIRGSSTKGAQASAQRLHTSAQAWLRKT
jgi:hypothetical protein